MNFKMFKNLMLIMMIIFLMNFILTELNYMSKIQLYSFECGFDSVKWYFNNISNHFFKIGIVFVVFDLELMYLLFFYFMKMKMMLIFFILSFILLTLYMEIFFLNISWSN